MAPAKPSLQLLRSLSDEHVLRALMTQRHATRAEIATVTGLSKPTISESVKRLSDAGAVVDTGERTSGRGRVGTYYALPPTTGCALVVSIAPEGLTAEAIDVYGDVVARAEAPAERVAQTLERLARQVASDPVRLAVISAADPVDRQTGRLVELPDAPFLVGTLDPRAVLADLVDGPVIVDNDVNWAARAEHHAGRGNDFVYLYLGEGLGAAVLSDGEVRRGHHGLAGEIAHLITTGPGGAAMPFTEVFAALGLRRPGSTAIDVQALLHGVDETLAKAIGGVLSAMIALADPALVVLGGPWGPAALEGVRRAFAGAPRHVEIEAATVTLEPALHAARTTALQELRSAIVDSGV